MYHKNSCQARHIRPPSRIPERLVGHVRPPSRISERLTGQVWPPSRIPERLVGHVRDSEGNGLLIYRSIYRLGRSIFDRFPPVVIDFLAGRPAITRPARFPAESSRFSPCRHSFLQPPTHPRALPGLSAQPSITARFRPVFDLPLPILNLPNRLQLLSRPEQMWNEEYTLLPSWGDRIPYT
jgi:hypothetical protein